MPSLISQVPGFQPNSIWHARLRTGTDLSSAANARQNSGRGVVIGATGLAVIAGANVDTIGVLEAVEDATYWRIRLKTPILKVRSGGAFNEAALLTTDASGDFVLATTGQNAEYYALDASADADEAVRVIALNGKATVA